MNEWCEWFEWNEWIWITWMNKSMNGKIPDAILAYC
jgi:hypothetical protein